MSTGAGTTTISQVGTASAAVATADLQIAWRFPNPDAPSVRLPAAGESELAGRSGRADIRSVAGSWCNVKGAGLGERPRAAPAPLVDAYLYVKVPGESDGTSDPRAARFDATCASDDAAPGAPEAGLMFDAYLIDLLRNAQPPL